MRVRLAALFSLLPSICFAQALVQTAPSAPDLSPYAKTSDVAASIAALNVPAPASTTPASEATAGAVGSNTGQYALANHVHPRITRSATWTVGANGVLTGTWATALPAAPGAVIYSPTDPSGQTTCQNSAAPTASGFTAVCMKTTASTLSLSIVTAGLTVGPQFAPSGTQVGVLAIPPSQ